MIEDTYQSGELWLKVEEKEGQVHFHIDNTGIGMPDEKLKQLMGADTIDSEGVEISELHHAIPRVHQWDGTLQFSSKIGEGTHIELSLKSFM